MFAGTEALTPPRRRGQRLQPEFDPPAIARRIAKAREKVMTQAALANLMHVHPRTVQTWETGEAVRQNGETTEKRRWPVPWTRLAELAWHLRTTREWLLYGGDR